MVRLNYDILTKEIFPTSLIMEYEGSKTSLYNKYWYITHADSSIYIHECLIEDLVGSGFYILDVINGFIKVSNGVIYVITNSKLWKLRSLALVNINDMNTLSSILTKSLNTPSCYNAIGITDRLEFTNLDQSNSVDVCRETVIYDMRTNSVWEAKECIIPHAARPFPLSHNTSLETMLIRTPTEEILMKYSVYLLSKHRLNNLYTNLENFTVSSVENGGIFKYRLLSKDSWPVRSEKDVIKLIEGIYTYCGFFLPTITDIFTET